MDPLIRSQQNSRWFGMVTFVNYVLQYQNHYLVTLVIKDCILVLVVVLALMVVGNIVGWIMLVECFDNIQTK